MLDRYKVDKDRIFAVGMSGGARMVSRLACDSELKFAAIAPIAGLQYPLAKDGVPSCKPKSSVPIITFHGIDDHLNDYDQAGVFPTWKRSVESTLAMWASHNGCDKKPKISVVERIDSSIIEYVNCRNNATVKLYAIDGLKHKWPEKPKPADYIFDFFKLY